MKKNLIILFILSLTVILTGCTFIEPGSISYYNAPGFFVGIWHGLLAPYTLIVRWFADIEMYAVPNSGWFYDCGFLIGILFSLPIGWIAAIIAIGFLIL